MVKPGITGPCRFTAIAADLLSNKDSAGRPSWHPSREWVRPEGAEPHPPLKSKGESGEPGLSPGAARSGFPVVEERGRGVAEGRGAWIL